MLLRPIRLVSRLIGRDSTENQVADYRTIAYPFYLRIRSDNPEQLEKKIHAAMLDSVFLSRRQQPQEELAVVTPAMDDYQLEKVLKEVLDNNDSILGKIRVLDY